MQLFVDKDCDGNENDLKYFLFLAQASMVLRRMIKIIQKKSSQIFF